MYVLFLGGSQLSARAAQGEVRDAGVPSEHRSSGQCLPEHLARRLEACADRQLDCLWSAVFVFGKKSLKRM